MTSELFNEIGLQLPIAGNPVAAGATVLTLTDASAATRVQGEIVRLVPEYSDTLGNQGVHYDRFTTVGSTAATLTGLENQSHVFGVCLEDIANGDQGRVLVRGSCLALVEKVTTNINSASAFFLNAGSTVGDATNLTILEDHTSTHYVKIIGQYVGASIITAATTTLQPVVFNGFEGFMTAAAP